MKYSHADYVMIFKALSDETRLKIVDMLAFGELCACDILEHFHISQPTLSYHMKILTQCSLVISRSDGAWKRYSLNKETLNALSDLFDSIKEKEPQSKKICQDNQCR